jgi:hypothetical protein
MNEGFSDGGAVGTADGRADGMNVGITDGGAVGSADGS